MEKLHGTTQPGFDAIDMLIQWATAQDAVRAVLLTSTRAIPDSVIDALSDYDVILIVQDIQPYVNDHAWLNDFGEVLITYWDPIHPDPIFGIDRCANVTQYCDGLKIDFNLWPVTLLQRIVSASNLPAELDAGYRFCLTKTSSRMRCTRRLASLTYPKSPHRRNFSC
jgi:aminoglycoside 6-adenylyltransferase